MRGGECAQLQRFQRHQIQTQHEHQTVGSAARQLGGPGKPRAAADRERLRRRLVRVRVRVRVRVTLGLGLGLGSG